MLKEVLKGKEVFPLTWLFGLCSFEKYILSLPFDSLEV